MSAPEKLSIVLGNPLITFRGVHYSAKRGCDTDTTVLADSDESVADEVTDPGGATCDPTPPKVTKHPEDLEYINTQTSAVQAGLSAAQGEVKRRLVRAYDSDATAQRVVRILAEDEFALKDRRKKGRFHPAFQERFVKRAGRSLADYEELLEDVDAKLEDTLATVRLFVQLDAPGEVKDYLTPDGYRDIGQFLLDSRGKAFSHSRFKVATIGDRALRFGFQLHNTHSQVREPFDAMLKKTLFRPEDVSVLFERVIRDQMFRLGLAWDWDEEVNTHSVTGVPFYVPSPGEEPRNAVNFVESEKRGDRKPVIACMGVVAGVPTLVAHQHPGSVVRMFMEPDAIQRRVDSQIIRGGLAFYDNRVAPEKTIPSSPGHPEMTMPKPVTTELFMTNTSVEPVDLGEE